MTSLPWPVGLVAGVIAFVAIRYGIGWAALASGHAYLVPMSEGGVTAHYRPLRGSRSVFLGWRRVSLFERKGSRAPGNAPPGRRVLTVRPRSGHNMIALPGLEMAFPLRVQNLLGSIQRA